MKTSFYFVLWMCVYPLLWLMHSSFIDDNSFIIALISIWGLSWLLNRLLPKTLTYDHILTEAPVLEDVYTGNVMSFRKLLSAKTLIEIITSIYFLATVTVILIAILEAGANDWLALIIFVLFTFGSITRSVMLVNAKTQLRENPTPEQCMEIANDVYDLNYEAYYNMRRECPYADMFPQPPRYFIIFRIVSILFAAIAALLGIQLIILGSVILFGNESIEGVSLATMYFLYGSLAAYFGIRDFISCIHTKSNTISISKEQTA